jgi:hypothetical protein
MNLIACGKENDTSMGVCKQQTTLTYVGGRARKETKIASDGAGRLDEPAAAGGGGRIFG